MLPRSLVLCNTKGLAVDRKVDASEMPGPCVGGDYAEVAATNSRCNRDGVYLGSSMVRCGLSAALVVWLQSRCPVPYRLRDTGLHRRSHVLRRPRLHRKPSHV